MLVVIGHHTNNIHFAKNTCTWPHASCRSRKYSESWLIPLTYRTINHEEDIYPFPSLLRCSHLC